MQQTIYPKGQKTCADLNKKLKLESKMSRIEKEKHIIEVMIGIYCRKKHKTKNTLCPECQELLDYSRQRLDKCKFGENKSYCQKCTVHCYKKSMKSKIKEVMRFSGPRILFYNPVEFFKHMFSK